MAPKPKYWYVYIITSLSNPGHFYTGFTEDLDDRLAHHNSGAVPSTTSHAPWAYKTVISFTDEEQARSFERYLKTRSGRAFAKKRL